MNTMKKLFSLCLALMMLLSLAVPAMADDEVHSHTITINESNAGHTYKAYQIFDGDVVEKDLDNNEDTPLVKILTNVTWGAHVDITKTYEWKAGEHLTLVQALQSSVANPVYYGKYVGIPNSGTDSPDDGYETDAHIANAVANALASQNEAAHANAFAKVVGRYLKESTNTSTGSNPYKIENLDCGYYLVRDEADVVGETRTDYIMQLVSDVQVTPKDGTVTVNKNIMEGGTPVKQCSNNIGDTVTFRIDATVPGNLNEFEELQYYFVDTMVDGLVLVPGTGKVYTVNGDDLKEIDRNFYEVYTDDNEGIPQEYQDASLVVGFEDLKALVADGNHTITTNTVIRVEYEAVLVSGATIGHNGNKNEVYVEFSSDPYNLAETNTTAKSEVHLFTFQLDVNKINGKTGVALDGVKFVVNRERQGHAQYVVLDNNNNVKGWTNWIDEADLDAYLALKYTDEDERAKKKDELLDEYGVATQLVTDSNGKFSVKGLDLDVYWLVETQTKDDTYSKIDPIQFTISAGYDAESNTPESLQIIIDNIPTDGDSVNGIVSTTVVNNPGNTLPSTGGMGTTMFYIFGAAMVLGAIVLMVTKKRMEN